MILNYVPKNREVRYYRTPESKLKGAILLGCHHNPRAYFHDRMRAKLYQKLS
jgi:hypothetical protein